MNIQQLMRQAQEMQRKLAKQQEELATKEFEATSGGGMVTAKVSGAGQLLTLKIDPEVVNPQDIDMLQDLVVAAVNEALRKISEAGQGDMSDMMSKMGIKLPGFPGL